MQLALEELKAVTLVQEITRTSTALVNRIRLHLYKHLSPAGTFTCTVTDASDNVLASKSLTLAEMITASGTADLSANYYHGYVSFVFDKVCTLRPGDYKIKLSSSGYTYADAAFIGWVKAWDDRAIDVTGASSPLMVDAPYDLELYKLDRV